MGERFRGILSHGVQPRHDVDPPPRLAWILRVGNRQLPFDPVDRKRRRRGGTGPGHQRRLAVPGFAADDDQQHIPFAGIHDLRPHIARAGRAQHRDVAECACGERADRRRPAAREHSARVAGDHLHQVAVREAEMLRAGDDLRDLELGEDVQSAGATALQRMPMTVLRRQPACAASVNSCATTEPCCPSEQW